MSSEYLSGVLETLEGCLTGSNLGDAILTSLISVVLAGVRCETKAAGLLLALPRPDVHPLAIVDAGAGNIAADDTCSADGVPVYPQCSLQLAGLGVNLRLGRQRRLVGSADGGGRW